MLKPQKKKTFTIKNQIKELLLFKHRILAAVILIILLSIALFGRLVYLQVAQNNYYTTLSKNNEINLVPIPPKRGLIYDRNGVLLAKNIPVYSLMVIPDKVANLTQELKTIKTIIPLSSIDLQAFNKQIKQHRRFQQVPLKLKLTPEQVAKFAVNRYQFPGFIVKAELIRRYPLTTRFAHVVGYEGRMNAYDLSQINQSNYAETNYIGKTGIEAYYENTLHGTVGYQQVETDASGRVVRVLSTTPPIPGANIYLTIDGKFQAAIEQALKGYNGTAVAIQPDSGQILAMVSTPTFNPNLFVQGMSEKTYKALETNPNRPLYNRAVYGLYAIGSTIKPFIGLEGLASGIITPSYQIYDPGWFKIPGTKHIFHDWLRGGHGWVNLHKAIVVSCDTYFYNLAYHLGIQPIDHILTEVGFGRPSGLDFPGILSGTVPSPNYKMAVTGHPWYQGDTVNTAIGQGYMQATAVQLAAATATLANRGIRYQPTLLYAIQPAGQPKIIQPPQQLPSLDITNKAYWQTIIKAMEDVIPHGTGYAFGHTPYSIAAKTGTAQVRSDNDHFDVKLPKNERSNSIFIAFAPVKKPIIAIAVVIEHDPGAAPRVARKIMDYYMLTEHHWHQNTVTLNKTSDVQ